MGTDFAFVAPAASVIGAGGITAYFGGTMLGALLGSWFKLFRKTIVEIFPAGRYRIGYLFDGDDADVRCDGLGRRRFRI